MVVAEKTGSYRVSGADIKFVQNYLDKLGMGKVEARPMSGEMQKFLDEGFQSYKIRFENDRDEFRGFAILSEVQISVGSSPSQREYFAERRMIEILHNSGLNFEILEGAGGENSALKSLSHK